MNIFEAINPLATSNPLYPKLLKQIADPPLRLFYRGSLQVLNQPCLAVVGTRKMSDYGAGVTAEICKNIARAGITIISGLAYGIDAVAHEAALEAGGNTIAVIGSGLDDDSFYPPGNRGLARRILEQRGGMISEYTTGTPAMPYHFLARNRIIAGLARGTLVVECPEKSGALITAQYALEYNRDVYAVPGPITSKNSRGTNKLLKKGACVVTEAADILTDFGINPQRTGILPLPASLSKAETKIIRCLDTKPLSADEIIKQSGLPSGAALTALTFLEMKGIIRLLDTQRYIRTSP